MLRSLESVLGGALILVALLLFLTGMVFRLSSAKLGLGWIEEVTIYIVAWGLLLSAAGCVANNEHVRADFFLRLAGARTRWIADILAAIAGLVFCAAMAWFGWMVVEFSIMLDERGPSFLQIPTVWFYAAMPVSMLACSLRYLEQLVALIRNGQHDGEGAH